MLWTIIKAFIILDIIGVVFWLLIALIAGAITNKNDK